MHTTEKGDLSVASAVVCFLKRGFIVLKPISENSRYDLVIDRGLGFERVQCKTGFVKNGAIRFNTASSQYHNGKRLKRMSYHGQCDLFLIFCPETDCCYMISVDEVPNTQGALRIEEPKNKQLKGIRMACDYVV